jgi:hypothetical protein
MKRIAIVCLASLLAGCISIQNSKSLMVAPSTGPVAVTSTARAECWDLFFVLTCRLYMELATSEGTVVSDFPGSEQKP